MALRSFRYVGRWQYVFVTEYSGSSGELRNFVRVLTSV
jgi:hypothetical protein